MEIVDLLIKSTPLSTTYVGDEDLIFSGYLDKTEEGLTFFNEEYLKSPKDRRINNYSSLVLTDKVLGNDILKMGNVIDYTIPDTFTTSLKDTSSSLYLTVSGLSSYTFTEYDERFIDHNDRMFELSALNPLQMIVKHRDNNNLYYLNRTGSNFTFNTNTATVFNYVLDKTNNKIALFYNLSTVGLSAGKLALYSSPSAFKTINFSVNYYIQELSPRFNASWVSYDKLHKNSYEVNQSNSRNDLENNYVVSTQYSYVTGGRINANLITLKNQNTNKNYNYRSDNMEVRSDMKPSVDVREYTGLYTGNNQEKGDYGISLSYVFYNADYKFVSDDYTTFTTPDSLYPYDQINVNDLNWSKIGSIAGPNPYVSDKIFRKKIKGSVKDSEYLCTWLGKDKFGNNVWLDRYYTIVDNTSASSTKSEDPFKALLQTPLSAESYYDVYYQYNSVEEELANTPQTPETALSGRPIFDKYSDMVFVPNEEYIYFHIGNNYIKKYIDSISSYTIQNGLSIVNQNGTVVQSGSGDSVEYAFDNTKYAQINEYSKINDAHQFTISFWLKSDDWNAPFGHQLMGNMNDKGIAVYADRKITPLITVQNGTDTVVFNTDFLELDRASIKHEETTRIKDIYRTDHLDTFRLITID